MKSLISRDNLSRRQALCIFISMLALYSFSYFQRTAIPGTIFRELQSEGCNAFQIASMGSCFVCVYSVIQLLAGMLDDKYGGIHVVRFGGLFFLAGIIIFPLAQTPWLLYAGRILTGIGAGTLYLSLAYESDKLFGRKNFGLMLGIMYFIGYGGGLMGTLPMERAISVWPWRRVLLVIAAFSLLVYLLFVFTSRQVALPPPVSSKNLFHLVVKMLLNPRTWIIIYCYGVNFTAYFVIQTIFGKALLEDTGHYSSVKASSIIFALTIVSMSVLFITPIFSKLLGNKRKALLILSTVICLSSTLLMRLSMTYSWPSWNIALAVILYAVATGFAPIFTMSLQENNHSSIRTQAAAIINMIAYLLVAVASFAAGKFLVRYTDAAQQAGGAFPTEAYLQLFTFLLIPTTLSLVFSLFIPETNGKFVSGDQN